MYTGRFAPSPTGPLHMGSLIAALASWLDARAAGGQWLVRIEDLDRPRAVPGAAAEILRALERLGLHWDGEVVYQSRRDALYSAALDKLSQRAAGLRQLERPDAAVDQRRPKLTLQRGDDLRDRRLRVVEPVRRSGEGTGFADRLQGAQSQVLERDIGDFVLYRADGLYAYQLAVVVDDAAQGVTDVVRGADLLDSTPRQIYLQHLLGVPTPRYLHVPVAVNAAGEKLAKQTGAVPIEPSFQTVRSALRCLGQPDADDLDEAARNWDPALISPRRALALQP